MPFSPKISVENFFYAPKVLKAISAGKRRALIRAGSLQRAIMKNIFPRRKGPSSPPSPPHVHRSSRDDMALQRVLYAYDQDTDNVIVGPIGSRRPRMPVPQLLNEGGRSGGRFPILRATWKRYAERGPSVVVGYKNQRMMIYRKRPFVKPSLDKFIDKYPDVYNDMLLAVGGGFDLARAG